MNVGFTATRRSMTRLQYLAAMAWMARHDHPDSVHQGCCVGGDEELTQLASKYWPDAVIHAHPSNIEAMTSKSAIACSTVFHGALPPLDRNRVIVDIATEMLACPAEIEEQRRGGTWSTIRYARKLRVPLTIIYPDGTLEEPCASSH